MEPIEELLGRDHIRQLAQRYALAVDGKDTATIASLFVDDLDEGADGVGREATRARFERTLSTFHCSMHLVANHVIDFDDDNHAHGVVYCYVRHHRLEPEHWQDNAMAYFDTYERHGQTWHFRRRRIETWYRQWFGHPEHDSQRVAPDAAALSGRHGRLPDDFPTFDAFWARHSGPDGN